MPTIRVPTPLRQYTGGQAEVLVTGSNVGAALDDLLQRFPGLRQQLYDAKGELVRSTYESVNIVLNKHDFRELQGPDTPLGEKDRLTILRTWPAAIAGGREYNKPAEAS